MNNFVKVLLASALFCVSMISHAQDSLIESVVTGCEQELLGYCGEVTPGEGRVLACLYAHGDKLSGQCEFALFDAAAQLDRFISSLTYLVNECAEDIDTHCAAVEAGEGRLAQCLLDNKPSLQPRCGTAIDITELSVE
jgi:hypothetical protein